MSRVELVGILNVTPDSFSDGGLYIDPEKAIEHAKQLNDEGAAWIDVGAESTRPGATKLTSEEEQERLYPVLKELIYPFRGRLSLDTYHPETIAWAAREIGNVIVNDVTGFNNPRMMEVVAELRLPCIVSHLPEAYGQDIQEAHKDKPVDTVNQVHEELMTRRAQMINAGINKDMIYLDPGIGFGKVMELNWELLEFPKLVPAIDVMVGYSQKKFLGNDLVDGVERRFTIERNLEAGRIAVAAGAALLRVHNVAGHAVLLD